MATIITINIKLIQQGQSQNCINGHTEGNWVTINNPTLIANGTEELLCLVCDTSLDSRIIKKKSPQADGDHFNFTDKAFIEWFNSEGGSYTISNTELDEYGDDSSFTTYKITFLNSEIGTIMLSHGDDTAIAYLEVYQQ